MNKILMLLCTLSTIVVAMDNPNLYHANDKINVITLLANLACESHRETKNAKTIMTMLHHLNLITAVDKNFLTESQHKDWKAIIFGITKTAFSPYTTDNNATDTSDKFFDEIDDCMYPVNFEESRLDAIKDVKRYIHKGWDPSWAQQLNLKKDNNEVQPIIPDPEVIKNVRLTILKNKKHKALGKLEIARTSPPEKLPDFQTTKIHELLDHYSRVDNEYNGSLKDQKRDLLRTLCAYIRILMRIDFEWLSLPHRDKLEECVKDLEAPIWKDDRYSKLYYRWNLAAIDWAKTNVQSDKCENLAWTQSVFKPEKINYIANPSADELKSKRLLALKEYKEKVLELFQDFHKRKDLENENDLKDKCIVM